MNLPPLFPQSSLSVGSDLDLTDTPTPTYPLRRSWDASQEGAGLEVELAELGLIGCALAGSDPVLCPGPDVQLLAVPQLQLAGL